MVALGQSGDPFDTEVQAVTQARAQGRFADAAAHRGAARSLLDQAPRADRVAVVAALYANAGRIAEARAVILRALETQPRSLDLLLLAADSWHQERNLIQETAYVERAAAISAGPLLDQRLAALYRQLGRKEAFTAAIERLRAHSTESGVAEALEELGFFDDAAALYRRRAQEAPGDVQSAAAWRSAARLARRRNQDAVAADAERNARQLFPARRVVAIDSNCGDLTSSSQTERTLSAARQAATAGRTDDAFVLGLQSVTEATQAPQDDAVFSGVPILASMLTERNARGMADQLWERLLALAGQRSSDTLAPLLQVARAHARFLSGFPDRVASARAALERYRELLIAARGTESGELADALRLTLEFEHDHGTPERAAFAAEELLTLEETLNGADSIANLRPLKLAAALYQAQDNRQRVHSLRARAGRVLAAAGW